MARTRKADYLQTSTQQTLATPKRSKKGERLSTLERYQILDLHRKNPAMPMAEIARLLGRSDRVVSEILLAADRTVIDLMAAEADLRLQDWRKASEVSASRGDHRPAKEWLMHSGALDQLPDVSKGSGPAVVIINSPLPGMPGGVSIGTVTHDVLPVRTDDRDR